MCFRHQITGSTTPRRRDTKEVILLIALASCPERDSKLQGGEGNPKGAWQSLWAEKMELRIRGARWLESTEQSTRRERAVQRFWRLAEAPLPQPKPSPEYWASAGMWGNYPRPEKEPLGKERAEQFPSCTGLEIVDVLGSLSGETCNSRVQWEGRITRKCKDTLAGRW